MPEPTLDLDAYFARIGYAGPRTPTLETLRALQFAHVCAVPFENLDVLLGRRISLEPAALFAKIVSARRGGYCFEQNSLLRDVLRTLGFAVTPLIARVRRQVPPERRTGLTHMVLRIDLAGRPWLVDVGFGSVGATAPLALDTAAEQSTPHELRRIVAADGVVTHQILTAAGWADVYEFRLEPPAPIDFELGNWYSCTHPQANFVNNLVVARAAADRRLTIFNREFTTRFRDGRVELRELASADDLLAVLDRTFDLHFPAGTRFDVPGAPWPT